MDCVECGCGGNSECGKDVQDCSLDETGVCPCCAASLQHAKDQRVVLNDLLYGVVEWINGNPTLDGMPYFDDKDAALKYATERGDMGSMGLPMKVEYTVIKLKKAI